MPTYQRIIKKSRLKEIKEFVNNGNFFPNSVIISIDTHGRKLNFDLASLRGDSDRTRIGILHLPQRYRTAYVIDGQHRLYGYADSEYVGKDTIPVIAFENLDQSKQLELFMQINENQKSVPKNLQNTLNADLLWDDDDWNKRRKALRLRIAQELGEKQASPLFGRIIIGENETTSVCCITIETIENALRATKFLSKYTRGNEITENGTFDKGENNATNKILYRFLELALSYFKKYLPEEWQRGDQEQGILVINNSLQAIIRILDNIVNLLVENKKVMPTTDSPERVFEETTYYLDPLVDFFKEISEDERREIKTYYGAGGKPKVWRTYQKVISEERNDFNPDGLQEWIDNNTKKYNEESFKMIRDLESFFKLDFKKRLFEKFGDSWLTLALPKNVYKSASDLATEKELEDGKPRGSVDIWDCLTIINYRDIAMYGKNWSEIFDKHYTRPGEESISGGKEAKTGWMVKLNVIRNKNFHTYSITKDEFEFLTELKQWLLAS